MSDTRTDPTYAAPAKGPAKGPATDPLPGDTMFASSSVPVHLLRGALGLPLLVAAFVLIGPVGPWTLLLAVPAVLLLRGCPTCWLLGLAQTRASRGRRA